MRRGGYSWIILMVRYVHHSQRAACWPLLPAAQATAYRSTYYWYVRYGRSLELPSAAVPRPPGPYIVDNGDTRGDVTTGGDIQIIHSHLEVASIAGEREPS